MNLKKNLLFQIPNCFKKNCFKKKFCELEKQARYSSVKGLYDGECSIYVHGR